VLLELWTSREPSFTGKYTQFSGLVFEPKPLQKPYPPIWVRGHSRAALRRTVQFGAAWHPINRSPEELRAGRAELTRLSKVRGRTEPPTITLRNECASFGLARVCRLRPTADGCSPASELPWSIRLNRTRFLWTPSRLR
ncbi:MAG: hypothetical protein DME11_17245, partial [Candidatus Rokuibacteriota bacterium]